MGQIDYCPRWRLEIILVRPGRVLAPFNNAAIYDFFPSCSVLSIRRNVDQGIVSGRLRIDF
jgi:hypothetical protein